jgi:hypothetical protein
LGFDHAQLIAQLLEQLRAAMLALALLPLGGLRDYFQIGEVAHPVLLRCGLCAHHSGMLLSDAGQFLPKKDAKSGI